MSAPAGSARRGGAQIIPRPSGWKPGRPAPWSQLPAADRVVDLERVEAMLAARGAGRMRQGNWVPSDLTRTSAVLVPLYEHAGELHVVLTRRSANLRSHTSEVAFPGGRSDEGESPLVTALREAEEEIGLAPSLVRPIGELDQFVTVGSRSLVHPMVGALDTQPLLRPAPDEVEHILHVSVAELLAEGVFREELWPIADRDRPITFFELYGDTVWGATAAMLRQLLSLAVGLTDDGLTY